MIRVVILTDSLGCPRDKIDVKDTWVDKILHEFQNIIFYPINIYGLSASNIDMNRLKYLQADALICQIGIVDACRRALSKKEGRILSHIPIIGRLVHKIVKKHHFQFTKMRKIHYSNVSDFKYKMEEIIGYVNGKCYFVEIAQPGGVLVENTFAVKNDVALYNSIFEEMENQKVTLLKPYSDSGYSNPNDYLLKEDGHHLNLLGEELVYKSVKGAVCEILREKYSEERELN